MENIEEISEYVGDYRHGGGPRHLWSDLVPGILTTPPAIPKACTRPGLTLAEHCILELIQMHSENESYDVTFCRSTLVVVVSEKPKKKIYGTNLIVRNFKENNPVRDL